MSVMDGGTQLQWATVTVTYNSEPVLNYFCETVRSFKNVVVVDNNSSDNTVSLLRSKLPHANTLEQNKNIGFGPANNIGFDSLKGSIDYVLFLNPDCQVIEEDVLKLIHTLKERPDAGIVCPVVKSSEGSIGTLKIRDYKLGFKHAAITELDCDSAIQSQQIIENGCIDGACFLVDVKKFRAIGGFDNNIFMYFEEDDIGLRMAEHGFSILINTACSAIHAGGKSTTNTTRIKLRRAYHYRWSKYHLTNKYEGPLKRFAKAIKDLMISPIKCILYALAFNKPRLTTALGWWLASIDGLILTKLFRFL